MGTTSDAARGNLNRCKPHHPKALIEQARQLWDGEGYSAKEVAERIGLSRSAVCALARRNDFTERGSPIKYGEK